jgi:hypothetical protein
MGLSVSNTTKKERERQTDRQRDRVWVENKGLKSEKQGLMWEGIAYLLCFCFDMLVLVFLSLSLSLSFSSFVSLEFIKISLLGGRWS